MSDQPEFTNKAGNRRGINFAQLDSLHARRREKGEPQTSHMNFSSTITWLARSLLGATSNIHGTLSQLHGHKSIQSLDTFDKETYDNLIRRCEHMARELDSLQREIASFNKGKKLRKMENPPS